MWGSPSGSDCSSAERILIPVLASTTVAFVPLAVAASSNQASRCTPFLTMTLADRSESRSLADGS